MLKKILSLALSVMLLAFTGCQETTSKTAIYFDTVVTLKAEGEIPKEAFSMLERYDKLFSATNKNSELYKLNTSGELVVDSELASVIEKSLEYSGISGGSFDITVLPLKELWGFSKSPKVPTKAQIKTALQKVDYKAIEIDGNRVNLNGMQIDLGGIAKGYIADKLAELYIKNDIDGIINLGGNIMLPTLQKKPYKIGITDPNNTDEIIATVNVNSGAVVTSGTYERNFTENGKTYHHILDTKSGYPVKSGIASATVLSPSATSADALSTILICFGENEGLKLINSLDNTEAILVTDSGEIELSNGLIKENKTIKYK